MKKILSFLGLFGLLFLAQAIDDPAVPNTFSSGGTILASQFNDNFDSLTKNTLRTNDTLDNKFIRYLDLANSDTTLPRVQADTVHITDEFIFNEAGAARNARFESDANINLIFTDGTNNRVGIGTGSPTALLDVMGEARIDGPFILNDGGGSTQDVRFESKNNANMFFLDASTDRIGINTGAPAFGFEVGTATHLGSGVTFNEAGNDVDARFESSNNSNMFFLEGGTDRIGINEGTPLATLDVNGFIKLGTNSPILKFKRLSGTTAASEGGTTSIAHGVTGTKIISIMAIVQGGTNNSIPNATIPTETEYSVYSNATNVIVALSASNSGSILSKTVIVTVVHEE